jgi:hypothetical protein
MLRSFVLLTVVVSVACSEGGSDRTPGNHSAPPLPPEVSATTPTEAPWGTTLTIEGKGLGSASRTGIELSIGELQLSPGNDGGVIQRWTETEIELRVPFPYAGPIHIETPQGAADAGEFTPTWTTGPELDIGPASVVVSSVSPGAGRIAILLEAGHLLEVDEDAVVDRTIEADGADLSTAKLFVAESGDVEGIALTTGATPELIHLAREGENLVGKSTGITGPWESALLAGGSDGGFAWLETTTGWSRIAQSVGTWSVDKGPLSDPAPSDGLRAAAATSDGALHVTWNVETGNLVDDTEAPTLASVAADATTFSAELGAGSSVDDYLTVLELEPRGYGLRLHYCGSDVDPVLGTPAEESCRTNVRTSDGESTSSFVQEDELNRYVLTSTFIGSARCTADGLVLSTDQEDPGEVAIWECPRVLAVEVDEAGYFLPIVSAESGIWSARRR